MTSEPSKPDVPADEGQSAPTPERPTRSGAITALLIGTNLFILLVAGAIGVWMTERYDDFVRNSDRSAVARVVEVATREMLWTSHLGLVQNLAGLIAENRDVRGLVTETDEARIKAVLANEFGRDLLTRGEVRMLGLGIYSPELRKVGDRWGDRTAEAPPREPPAALLDAVRNRSVRDRLRQMVQVWTDGGTPVLTVVAPLGGLRVAGYVLVHVDPLAALGRLDERVGSQTAILAHGGDRVLRTLENVRPPANGSALDETRVTLSSPEGVPFADVRLRRDMGPLEAFLGAELNRSLLIFVVLGGLAAILAIVTVWTALRRARRREDAYAAALAERARALEASNAYLTTARDEAEAARSAAERATQA
uniref:hypothetical protein n=1 Tax=Stella sp. TaxID=2912054 RepID=UPI0035B18281